MELAVQKITSPAAGNRIHYKVVCDKGDDLVNGSGDEFEAQHGGSLDQRLLIWRGCLHHHGSNSEI